jgi:hypothetical protein
MHSLGPSQAATSRSKPHLMYAARNPNTGMPCQRRSYPGNQPSKETARSPFSLRQKPVFPGLVPVPFPDKKLLFIGYGPNQIRDKTDPARSSETIVMPVSSQLRRGVKIINADFRSLIHIIPWV